MITVRELTSDLELELLAGAGRADAPIHWVHISEELDPTPWLSEGDLLLCTGERLTGDVEQHDYITRLAGRGLAGLGCGSGSETLPPALIAAAREHDFPLFGIPFDTPFKAVTERAFAVLVNENYAVLRRAVVAQDAIEQIVLAEGGLDSIAATLAKQIGGELLIFDSRGQLLTQKTAHYGLSGDLVDALSDELSARLGNGACDAFAPEAGGLLGRALALPVVPSTEPLAPGASPQAWLVATKVSGFDEFDRLFLRRATTVVALELMRTRVAGSTRRQLASEILVQIASGSLAGPELERSLAPFELGDEVAALVVSTSETAEHIENALDAALRDEAVDGLVASAEGATCALLPGYPDDELFDIVARVHGRISKKISDAQTAVGRAVATADARHSYREARCALEARTLWDVDGETCGEPRSSVATYRDLGSLALLLSLQDTEALKLYCDSLLGPLEGGENAYGDELLRSLDTFIACNGQWEVASRRLYCHRHTLRYRIRRIEELTGRDLSLASDRIEFWLAIRARELVS